jgi:hypothetical protein
LVNTEKKEGEKKSKAGTSEMWGWWKKKKVAYTEEKVEKNCPGPGGKISKYPR